MILRVEKVGRIAPKPNLAFGVMGKGGLGMREILRLNCIADSLPQFPNCDPVRERLDRPLRVEKEVCHLICSLQSVGKVVGAGGADEPTVVDEQIGILCETGGDLNIDASLVSQICDDFAVILAVHEFVGLESQISVHNLLLVSVGP